MSKRPPPGGCTPPRPPPPSRVYPLSSGTPSYANTFEENTQLLNEEQPKDDIVEGLQRSRDRYNVNELVKTFRTQNSVDIRFEHLTPEDLLFMAQSLHHPRCIVTTLRIPCTLCFYVFLLFGVLD